MCGVVVSCALCMAMCDLSDIWLCGDHTTLVLAKIDVVDETPIAMTKTYHEREDETVTTSTNRHTSHFMT